MPERLTKTLLALCLLLLACHDQRESGVVVAMTYNAQGRAEQLYDAPFPSDTWRGSEGKLSEAPPLDLLFGREAASMAAHLALLDGFGTRPQIQFPLTGAIDPQTLPQSSAGLEDAIFVINVDAESPERGRVVPYEWRYGGGDLTLRGAPVPGTVLESGAAYAAVLTTALRDPEGQPLRASPTLHELRSESVPVGLASTAAALDYLEEQLGLAGQIAGLSAFTVQDALGVMQATRGWLQAGESPARVGFPDASLIFSGAQELQALLGVPARADDGPRQGMERWGRANPTGIAHESVGTIATGELRLPRFRRPSTGDMSTSDGTFAIQADKRAIVQEQSKIPVTLVLPAAPPPDSGYPVVIFGHGLGASRHAVLTFAEPLTRKGMAIFAIDFAGHGSRYDSRDRGNNSSKIISDFQGQPDLRDGFGDVDGLVTTFDFMGGFRNFSTARDGIRQSVLDVSSLCLALRRGRIDLLPLATEAGTPVLDTSTIAYMGESFGTLVGGVLAAIEPEIALYILDVPGAGIVDLAIVNSPALASLLLPLSHFFYGWVQVPDRFDARVAILQSMMDAADPLSYAPHVLRNRLSVGDRTVGPRHVLAIEVLGDEAIHNVATDSWARAMGLELLVPHETRPPGIRSVDSPAAANVDAQTGVIVQYGPATHGDNWTSEVGQQGFVPGFPHPGEEPFPRLPEARRIDNPMYETLEQVVEVLEDHQRGRAPRVKSKAIPRF